MKDVQSSEKKKYLIKFYYLGARKFFGSQRQTKELTVERCILNVLKKKGYIENEKDSEFESASRTDRLVSAKGAAFSFLSNKAPILMEINSELPLEIGVHAYAEVPVDFSSRHNAIYRHYKYLVPLSLLLVNGDSSFDTKILSKACKELEGQHDFINFSKINKVKENTVRKLISVNFYIDDEFLVFDIKGYAFLRQQIRRMVKKVVELGKGLITFDQFLELFDTSKKFSYQPIDPIGLILWDVVYDTRVILHSDIKSVRRMEEYFLDQEHNYRRKQKLFEILQHSDFS